MIPLKPYSETNKNYQVLADFQLKKTEGNLLGLMQFKISEQLNRQLKWVSNSAVQNQLIRKDEIWKTTCFEFFLQPRNQKSYLEFNLNDQGDWNLYYFENYRNPSPPVWLENAKIQHFKVQQDQGLIQAEVFINLNVAELKKYDQYAEFQVGLTAITELQTGEKVFWAIEHTNDKPDFHQDKSFQLTRTIQWHSN